MGSENGPGPKEGRAYANAKQKSGEKGFGTES